MISGILATSSFSLFAATGFMAGLHPAFMGVLSLAGLHMGWQTWKLNPKDAPLCDHLLNISYRNGLFVFLAYLVGVWLMKKKTNEKK